MLGYRIRWSKLLYEGYKNLIDRILELEAKNRALILQTGSDTTNQLPRKRGVALASSAAERFERLRDRLQYLVLSGFQTIIEEKDGLFSLVRYSDLLEHVKSRSNIL